MALLTLAIVAFLVGAAIVLWWNDETNDSWYLWHDGVPVDAAVVGLADRVLLPADLQVQFEWEGAQQVRTIPPLWIPLPPYWFQTWDSDMVGQQITILVNPANPETVRLQDQGRVDPLHLLLVIAGTIVAGMAAAAWHRNRDARRAVESGRWVAHAVEMKRGLLPRSPVIEKAELGVLVRRARRVRDPAPGWVARHRNSAVAVHEPTDSITVASLRWRQARDKTFRIAPES